MKLSTTKGEIVMVVMVFIAIFAGVFSALANLLILQGKTQSNKEAIGSAFEIAESGMSYYRWYMAHYPNITPGEIPESAGGNGTGISREYVDVNKNPIGRYVVELQNHSSCGKTQSTDILATGWTYNNPTIKKTIKARYARPSVAQYSYIIDSDVWVGEDRQINGPYHSNGGIRMDGTNDSTVSSKLATWKCTTSFGCTTPFQTKNGVFGSGTGSSLWQYPASWIDFANIESTFGDLQHMGQDSGVYLPLSSLGPGNNGNKGWHIVFRNDGTFTASRVKTVTTVWGESPDLVWAQEGSIIKTEGTPTTYTLPSSCSLIFVEDDVWIEGTVKGKVAIVAGNVDAVESSIKRSIIVRNNINYTAQTGEDGLTVLSQKNILIPLDSPDTLSVHGIFIAQGGYFGRNHYTSSGAYSVPSAYSSYIKRTQMNIFGSVVSKGRVGTKWTSGGTWISGYGLRVDTYDRYLAKDPPPMTPVISPEYQMTQWSEL